MRVQCGHLKFLTDPKLHQGIAIPEAVLRINLFTAMPTHQDSMGNGLLQFCGSTDRSMQGCNETTCPVQVPVLESSKECHFSFH